MDLEHERRLTDVEARAASNTQRLEDLENRQSDLEKLTSSVAELTSNQRHIEGDVREIKADVKSMAAKPGKRWDGMIDKLIAVLAGAFLAWVMSGASGLN